MPNGRSRCVVAARPRLVYRAAPRSTAASWQARSWSVFSPCVLYIVEHDAADEIGFEQSRRIELARRLERREIRNQCLKVSLGLAAQPLRLRDLDCNETDGVAGLAATDHGNIRGDHR